jgi:hypothetical protein
MPVVAVTTNGAPEPRVSDAGCGTMRGVRSIGFTAGFVAGCGVAGGAAGRQAPTRSTPEMMVIV